MCSSDLARWPHLEQAWISSGGPPLPPSLHPNHGSAAPLDRESLELGIPHPLAASGLHGRTSIYADDVVTFLKPSMEDSRTFMSLIEDFGVALGLRTNLDKCSAHLIRCERSVEGLVTQELRCPILPFPLLYLGLPMSFWKPTAAQLQYLVDNSPAI